MGKFYVDVIFAICTFSFFFALVLSFLKKNISLINKIISFSILAVGIFLGLYMHILRVKNKKEMVHTVTKLNRYVLVLCLFIFILMSISLIISIFVKNKKISKVIKSLDLAFMFTSISCMLYLIIPRLLTQAMEFIAFGEDSVSTMTLFRVSGYILGILTGVLLVLALYKFLIRCSKKQYFIIFTLIFINTFLEYALRGITSIVRLKQYLKKDFNMGPILTENSKVFGIKTFDLMIFEDKSDVYFIAIAFAIIFIGALYFVYKNFKVKGEFESKASLRKEKWRLIVNRRWAYFTTVLSFVMLFSVTYLNYQLTRPVELTAAQPYKEEGNNIIIPLTDVDDGHLHRFSYNKDGHDIRFIVVKKPNSTSYGLGLDACQICGIAGYFERKDDIVCKRCDVVMNKATIGFKGGCNPIPFEYKIENSKIIIDKSVLDKEKERFPIGE
ncbi:Fe-S-containing protein [uncultured Parvimonas sp.]|uniref:Fe-S-containing protein n=1 Tax=uncultured Parvimonas sp. TaxID=747372 RepID=UPI002889105A|nr:Fe-S-containing protein [uncultured Parvimonas sp.]